MSTLKFANRTCPNLLIEVNPSYSYPEKDIEVIHVPGRNGDIILENGSYKNASRSYSIAVISDNHAQLSQIAHTVSEWFFEPVGYQELEDSYDPDVVRHAVFKGPLELETILNEAGRATVNFECKPQAFLKDYLTERTVTNGSSFNNITKFTALPLFKITCRSDIHSARTITIGDTTITIDGSVNNIWIDSDLQDAYYETSNLNGSVTLSNGFPVFKSGNTSISFSSLISSVKVVPRLWTL